MIFRFEIFVSFPFFTDGSRNRRHLGSERETLARVWTGKGGNCEGKNSGGVREEIAFYGRNHDGVHLPDADEIDRGGPHSIN